MAEEQTTAIQAIGDRGIVLKDTNDAWNMACQVAQSGVCPDRYRGKPGDIIIATQSGREVGMSFMQSLGCIAVINGTPAMFDNGPMSLVLNSGKAEWIDEWWEQGTERLDQEPQYTALKDFPNDLAFCCQAKRVDQDKPTDIYRFSVADAKLAGLWEKKGQRGPSAWCTYPKRMMRARGRGFLLKDWFGDVLRGLRQAEEMEDAPKPTGGGLAELKNRAANATVTTEANPAPSAEPFDQVEGEVVDETQEPPPEPAGTLPAEKAPDPQPAPAKPAQSPPDPLPGLLKHLADVARQVRGQETDLPDDQWLDRACRDQFQCPLANLTAPMVVQLGRAVKAGNFDPATGQRLP
jgi:hypothetical protein